MLKVSVYRFGDDKRWADVRGGTRRPFRARLRERLICLLGWHHWMPVAIWNMCWSDTDGESWDGAYGDACLVCGTIFSDRYKSPHGMDMGDKFAIADEVGARPVLPWRRRRDFKKLLRSLPWPAGLVRLRRPF